MYLWRLHRYAIYALVMGAVYVFGLPAGVLFLLYRRRHTLFGNSKDPLIATTQSTFGFLYLSYGPTAWWWEVEELVRKLLLSAVVVLFDSGSPLQVQISSRILLCSHWQCLCSFELSSSWGRLWVGD